MEIAVEVEAVEERGIGKVKPAEERDKAVVGDLKKRGWGEVLFVVVWWERPIGC